jgi:hypothetical protein
MCKYLKEWMTEDYDKWKFEFNSDSYIGTLTGSDIDWKTYYVYDGHVNHGLILNNSEKKQLKIFFDNATYNLGDITYKKFKTKLINNSKFCHLDIEICPICLNEFDYFEIHHVIPLSEGGADKSNNKLKICGTCHAIITRGCLKERNIKNLIAFNHQLMYYGIDLYNINSLNEIRQEKLPETYLTLIDLYNKSSCEQKNIIDIFIKNNARFNYQFFRDLILNNITYNYHDKFIIPYLKEWEEIYCNIIKPCVC